MNIHENAQYAKLVNGLLVPATKAISLKGRIILHPTEEEYAQLGYLPVVDEMPSAEELPEGRRYEAKGWETKDGKIRRKYETVEIPHRPIFVSKSRIESVVDDMGKTAEFVAWLNSKATYIGGWMRGGDRIVYDPKTNGSDLQSLVEALGIEQEEIEELMAKVTM